MVIDNCLGNLTYLYLQRVQNYFNSLENTADEERLSLYGDEKIQRFKCGETKE